MSIAGLTPGSRPPLSSGMREVLAIIWIAVACGIGWAASFVAWSDVWRALQRSDPLWVCLAVLANLCALPLWAGAIRLFIPKAEPRRFSKLLEAVTLTMAAIQSLTIFGGGAVAAWVFLRYVGLSGGATISIMTLEQVATGIVKVLLVGLAVLSTAAPPSLRAAGGLLLLLVVVGFLALLWAAHSADGVRRRALQYRGKVGDTIASFANWTEHLAALRNPPVFASAVALSFGRRVMETLAILCIQKACNIPVSLELALLVIAAVSLAAIIPGIPGNVGTYEAAAVVAYGWGGVETETAVAAALLQHVAFLVAALVPGYTLFAFCRKRYGFP